MAGSRGRRARGANTSGATGRNVKVLCGCGCNKRLSSAQSARHLRGLAPRFIALNSMHRRASDMSYIRTGLSQAAPTIPTFLSDHSVLLNDNANDENRNVDDDMDSDANQSGNNLEADGQDSESDMDTNPALEHSPPPTNANIALALNAAMHRSLNSNDTVDSSSDSESENGDEEILEEDWTDDVLVDDDPFGWTLVNDELMDDGRGLSAEELLGEDFEREVANIENRITETDLQILRAFQYKHTYFLSRNAFKALPYVFPQINIPSIDRLRSRIRLLSGLDPVVYDCCINSCCCFIGSYESHRSCPFCNESRFTADGKTARKSYRYSPLIPRLRAMFENKSLCKELLYRHENQPLEPSSVSGLLQHPDDFIAIKDVWDGKVYNDLRKRRININGKESQTKYFSDPHDVALGLSTDGFAPWRKRKYTAWPLLIFNYNLPPEIRFHQKNIIPVSIIPGPKKPKDIDSFLYPLVEELLKLSDGVRAFDASTGELFCLHAFLIIAFGDIPAMSLLMKMKGHNGIAPCRMCNIHGIRIPGMDKCPHYVPLDRSSHPEPGSILKYDPKDLPMRTHAEFLSNAESVMTARTRAEEDELAKNYGIKGKTILAALDSFSLPFSVPYDFMHLIYENLFKNLISLWTNDFKGLGTGTGDYALGATVWEAIGAATAKASDTIPSSYSARLGSISGDRSTFTADNYSFWTQYIGPILLQHKFSQQQYYDHFVQLVKLVQTCLKYEYTVRDVKSIRDGFIGWVEIYERLYYQHSPTRLPACPLTIHALLHIADGIEACGPVWAYWAFPMERYCALMQRAVLNSRRHPYVTLDKFIAEDAMLSQLKMRYNLYSELSLQPPKNDGRGHRVPLYLTCILLPPHSINVLPSVQKDRISAALATRYEVHKTVAKRHLPQRIDQWGKVRRIDLGGGDTMTAALLGRTSLDRRDATHVRYETLIDLNARNRRQAVILQKATYYGQLLRIFCFTVEASAELRLAQSETLIFAEIQPCKILSRHSSLDIHYYKVYGTPRVFDITCIQCLVGRLKVDCNDSASEWALFDRSGELAQAYHVEEESMDGEA